LNNLTSASPLDSPPYFPELDLARISLTNREIVSSSTTQDLNRHSHSVPALLWLGSVE